MKVVVAAVGSPGRMLARAIAEYEERAARYWSLDIAEVKPERAGKGKTASHVRERESRRLSERVPNELAMVALTRRGTPMSSVDLAKYIQSLALHSHAGAAFLIGGPLGLTRDVIRESDRTLSLSSLTLPHDLARLILAEQLYRAGTIVRGEPYHKGAG